MRGIRFAMLLALPFILGTLYAGINLLYFKKDEFLIYFIVLLAVVLGIFFAKEEINYWYDEKYPPKLDVQIIAWLRNFFPFYNELQGSDREKFETRLALYLNARSFQLMLKEKRSIPEDFKAIIAAHGIQMTFGLEDFLIGDYDRIICYNHPFPTPQNKFLHTVEVHHEDGLMLISLEQLMLSIGQSKVKFNIASYAYAQALLELYPGLKEVELEVSNFSPAFDTDHISKITGFENLELKAISLVAFFTDTKTFAESFPAEYSEYKSILNYAY